jgi:hypothetical protein
MRVPAEGLGKSRPGYRTAVEPHVRRIDMHLTHHLRQVYHFRNVSHPYLERSNGRGGIERLAGAEMRRVGRPGGTVAGFVWDFAGERSPGSLVRSGLASIGINLSNFPGSDISGLDAFQALFEQCGFEETATRSIDVTIAFSNFESLWRAQTPKFGPMGKSVEDLSAAEHVRLMDHICATLPANPDGSIPYSVRAHAIKGRIPVLEST